MVELCLMASSTYPHGGFPQLHSLHNKTFKEIRSFTPISGTKQEKTLRSNCFNHKQSHIENPWTPIEWFSDSNQFTNLDSSRQKPLLIDLQDLSSGIVEKCTRHDENISQFSLSRFSEAERECVDYPLLSDSMGLHSLTIKMNPESLFPMTDEVFESHQSSLIYPRSNFFTPNPLLDFVGDLSSSSRMIMQQDGRVLFTGTEVETKDLLSIIEEFTLSRNSIKKDKLPSLVPYFTRRGRSEARTNVCDSSLKLKNIMVAPVKSPKKTKLKQSPMKKTSRNGGRESDIHRRSYLHACESLLSLVLGRRKGKTSILTLKQSGPELPQLLTQFSASIAGTGLAVLFTVLCKVAGGRVPFCASKMLNTGFGVGLVWLSWAVNQLRDSIIYISKNQNKLGLKDEEMMSRVDRSVNEIFVRAATIMAVIVLKIA